MTFFITWHSPLHKRRKDEKITSRSLSLAGFRVFSGSKSVYILPS